MLVGCDVASFQIVDAARTQVEPVASWFATPALGAALEPFLRRPYDRARPGLTEAALERGRSLLLPKLEDWEAAPRMLDAARDALGEKGAATFWDTYRRCSIIACPVHASFGRTFGVLVIASVDPDLSLTRGDLRVVEALADLASLALERSELLQAEAQRAREELMLKRAAEEVSSSLEPDRVYAHIVEHALRLTGASKALLTRLQPAGNELVAAAAIDFSEETVRMRHTLHDSMLGRWFAPAAPT